MSHDGNDIKVSFCPVPTPEVQAEILSTSVMNNTETSTMNKTNKKELGERSKFGPQLKFNSPNFDFKKELGQLPFPINIGEVNMSKL